MGYSLHLTKSYRFPLTSFPASICTGISSQIRTKLLDWAVWRARAGCYSQATLFSNDSKTLKESCDGWDRFLDQHHWSDLSSLIAIWDMHVPTQVQPIHWLRGICEIKSNKSMKSWFYIIIIWVNSFFGVHTTTGGDCLACVYCPKPHKTSDPTINCLIE